MITVDEALGLVLRHAKPLSARPVAAAEALGHVLAEDIVSDVDSPPYDKSMVDGYAVRSADLVGGRAELRLIEEIVAGSIPSRAVTAGGCTRIMTGAPVPDGADAVVMVERSGVAGPANDLIRIDVERLRAKQNILPRATSLRRGDVVLKIGRTLRPVELGLLAEVGRTTIRAIPAPRVAVLSTGNELVPAERAPVGSQIRNSNGPMLAAAVRRAGGIAVELGVARDEAGELRAKLAAGLECDVLVISGGVSAGVLDLVPGMLRELGVEEVFHKVRIKPGKPLWFGKRDRADGSATLVFGLPGNPVSSLVCFELFARPAMRHLSGKPGNSPVPTFMATLASDFTHRGDRPTYHPAQLELDGGQRQATVRPLEWAGSADLRGFARADALIVFPAGDRHYTAGETVSTISLDG